MTTKLDPAVMAQFIGSQQVYRHGFVPDVVYTEGIQYVAETAGAYWLIDEIATAQLVLHREEFQTWRLSIDGEKSSAWLNCEDGNGKLLYSRPVLYTDFPPEGITVWCVQKTILLPSEY